MIGDSGVPIEQIVDLCGHAGTSLTESVYRLVLLTGVVAMDKVFEDNEDDGDGS